jgi:hypothetical protein
LLEYDYEELLKKYDFIKKCEEDNLKLIDTLTEKANKYDASKMQITEQKSNNQKKIIDHGN